MFSQAKTWRYRVVGKCLGMTLVAFAACTGDPPEPGPEALEEPLGITGGDVPLPYNPTTKKVNWTAGYADLLAADAVAACYNALPVQSVRATTGFLRDTNPRYREQDAYLAWLAGKMRASVCPAVPTQPTSGWTADDWIFSQWISGRVCASGVCGTTVCNVDAATGAARNATLSMPSSSALDAYKLPTSSELANSDTTVPWGSWYTSDAYGHVRDEVAYAPLNLCIVERLRDHQNSTQVVFASSAELKRLHEIIRERAYAAVAQYNVLVRAFDKWNASVVRIDTPYTYAAIFSRWFKVLGTRGTRDAVMTQIGKDYALAITRLTEATAAQSEMLLRSPDARQLGSYQSVGTLHETIAPGSLSGPGGARIDALASYYGFGTLVSEGAGTAPLPIVTEDTSAPEIETLLGYARLANAFVLTGASNAIDVPANARALFDRTENYLRQQECAIDVDSTLCAGVVGPASDLDDYQLTRFHGVKLEHAQALTAALVELVFGRPALSPSSFEVTSNQTWQFGTPLRIPLNLTARVTGTHASAGDMTSASGGTLTLDADFGVGNPAAVWDARSADLVVARDWDVNVHPQHLGFAVRAGFGASGTARPRLTFGTAPALISAREVLTDLSVPLAKVHDAAQEALGVITRAVGTENVIVRNVIDYRSSWSPATECAAFWGQYEDDSAHYQEEELARYRCNVPRVATLANDPNRLRYTLDILSSDVIDASQVRFDAYTSPVATTSAFSSTSALTPLSLPVETEQHHARGEFVAGCGAGVNCQETTTTITLNPSASSQAPARVLLRDALAVNPSSSIGLTVAGPGELTAQITQAWEADRVDMAKPKYDGFGLPQSVGPMGDASLYGGPLGEEAYQWFLRSAADAASEATRAIERSYETLALEAQDETALAAADEKGKTIAKIELESICGPGRCEAERVKVDVGTTRLWLPKCHASTETESVKEICEAQRSAIGRLVGIAGRFRRFKLAKPVDAELDATTPTFRDYRGGELHGLFLEQWNAWRQLETSVSRGVNMAETTSLSRAAASDEKAAAQAEDEAAQARLDALSLQYAAELEQLGISQADYIQRRSELQAQYDQADADTDKCETWKTIGKNAGYSFKNGPEDYKSVCPTAPVVVPGPEQSDEAPVCSQQNHDPLRDDDHTAWSPNALLMAELRCTEAEERFNALAARWDDEDPPEGEEDDEETDPRDVLTRSALLVADFEAANNAQSATIDLEKNASTARRDTAASRKLAAVRQAVAADKDTLATVQAALGRFLASQAAIAAAYKRAQSIHARIDMEMKQDTNAIKTRMGLNREYRSYDLWRARALTENARRLAVTARRAVEMRFVVDLSEMRASEPFVEAPAVWADEIYETDLKPPLALGTVAGPDPQSGGRVGANTPVYTNKVSDYVTNLGLLVKGYAVARPQAAVRSDAEAIQLPGPAARLTAVDPSGVPHDYIDPGSVGWGFYCPNSGTWISHPKLASFDAGNTDLQTACRGTPPTRARLSFALDPWGRLSASNDEGPFKARHNVRWRQLAVNLTGSGIRDCARARDRQACYAEPFLRYGMRHVGPVQVTNYEQQWRSLDLPIALIEGGKALAAEEWVDPVTHGFNTGLVSSAARMEYAGRPVGGAYELILELTPDIRIDRIERVQLLAQSDYWVRQARTDDPDPAEPTAECGNGLLEEGETCEGDCPSYCGSDGDQCTVDRVVGSPLLCTSECVHQRVMECNPNPDGCCPGGCTASGDPDCPAPGCGDGETVMPEFCDPGSAGATASCDANCTSVTCGDGYTNAAAGESCDGSCPVSCEDGNVCTTDVQMGSAATCDVQCSHAPVVACTNGDGCCPSGCNRADDDDCAPVCGNAIVEVGEVCDGDCPASCSDSNVCTADALVGSAALCSARCEYVTVTACTNADGCCPGGCNTLTDSDCPAVCGNDLIEGTEVCDGNCAVDCPDMDGDACTLSALSGSPQTCTTGCEDMSACADGNACCPAGCTTANDNDCDIPCSDAFVTVSDHVAAGRAVSNCSTTGAIWSAAFEADSAPPTTYFTSVAGSTAVVSVCGENTAAGCAQAGNFSLRFQGGTTNPSAYINLNTAGLVTPTLRFYRRPYALEAGDTWVVEYSTNNGSTYTTLESLTNLPTGTSTSYASLSFPVPATAALRIRFRLASTETTDYVHLDTVSVTGCQFRAVGSNVALGFDGNQRLALRQEPSAPGNWISGTCPSVGAGNRWTCAISNGKLWCWGLNSNGQLGLGDTADRSSPMQVGTATDWLRLAVSDEDFTCAIRNNGELYCWGENGDGALGDGTTTRRLVPTRVGTASDWISVDAGADHACGIRAGGNLYCWGDNSSGKLGDGTGVDSLTAVAIAPTGSWTEVSANNQTTCGIRAGGLYCWGSNTEGTVGDGTTTNRNAPVRIGTLSTWSNLSLGARHACALQGTTMFCWGRGAEGELAQNNTTQSLVPLEVTSTTLWRQISATYRHTCGLRAGTLSCWGYNASSQVGDGGTQNRLTPFTVLPHGEWDSASAGTHHTCAIRRTDELYCWGGNTLGGIGDGTTTTRPAPTRVTPSAW
jgi:alpha-tubulin suppressor-like RCC1 family protein